MKLFPKRNNDMRVEVPIEVISAAVQLFLLSCIINYSFGKATR